MLADNSAYVNYSTIIRGPNELWHYFSRRIWQIA